MPKVSRDTASEVITMEGLEVHLEHLEHLDGGYTVCFESHRAHADLAPLLRGLPDDRCDFRRWGYVVAGSVQFRFPDRVEHYRAGDADYVPPGHVPVHLTGSELIEVSPTKPLTAAIGVVLSDLPAGPALGADSRGRP